jgi:hypothetical protein
VDQTNNSSAPPAAPATSSTNTGSNKNWHTTPISKFKTALSTTFRYRHGYHYKNHVTNHQHQDGQQQELAHHPHQQVQNSAQHNIQVPVPIAVSEKMQVWFHHIEVI